MRCSASSRSATPAPRCNLTVCCRLDGVAPKCSEDKKLYTWCQDQRKARRYEQLRTAGHKISKGNRISEAQITVRCLSLLSGLTVCVVAETREHRVRFLLWPRIRELALQIGSSHSKPLLECIRTGLKAAIAQNIIQITLSFR